MGPRLKRSGIFWTVRGANAVIALAAIFTAAGLTTTGSTDAADNLPTLRRTPPAIHPQSRIQSQRSASSDPPAPPAALARMRPPRAAAITTSIAPPYAIAS